MRLTLVATMLLTACGSPSFNGAALDPAEPAPALTLFDSTGTPFELTAQRGKVVLVFFGYTHCPDVCPTTLVDWRHVADSLGAKAADVRFVFVSVDPERDTPASVQRYAARFSPTFVGLTGATAAIDSLKSAWHIAAFRDGNPTDTSSTYTVSHPSQVFVIDNTGKLVLMQSAGMTVAQITSDIRALL
ncbi:MAG: SCO family protein [Gemmatimonadaceae bacterium]|nr:SCO family protein [Gemmatimonadaceae bacterium]